MDKLSILLTALCLPCFNGQALESIPSSSVLKKPQEALSLSCRGTGFDFSQYGMHWLRQPAGKTLEWLGLIYYDASKTVYASSVQGRIEITRENSKSLVHLRLSTLKPDDSAVYYCARITQLLQEAERLYKNRKPRVHSNRQGAAEDHNSLAAF
uniref:Immunoglobulin heavy variable 4-5 n=1 Tax=Echeneis naucrates TaxID=173247 RepID=A0A665UQX2_ECHNA